MYGPMVAGGRKALERTMTVNSERASACQAIKNIHNRFGGMILQHESLKPAQMWNILQLACVREVARFSRHVHSVLCSEGPAELFTRVLQYLQWVARSLIYVGTASMSF